MSAPDPVTFFAPWCGDEEREFRRRIHKAAIIAQARAPREKNGRARTLYWTAAQVASDWTFRRVDDLGDLERLLRALNQLLIAADNIVRVEGPDHVE